MLFMPSGINDKATASMAKAVSHYALADPRDMPLCLDYWHYNQLALDSGGYAHFKAGQPITTAMAKAYILATHEQRYLMRLALDQIGDHSRTHELHQDIFRHYYQYTPIYPWGAPRTHLNDYIETAPWVNLPAGRRPVVAIGGLAKIFRGGKGQPDPAEKKRLAAECERTIDELQALCEEFPGLFHILGLNNLKAIMRLRGLVASADSSKWLDGGRYGHIIFVDTRNGQLRQAPAKAIPDYEHMDRAERCRHNLKVLIEVSEGKPK